MKKPNNRLKRLIPVLALGISLFANQLFNSSKSSAADFYEDDSIVAESEPGTITAPLSEEILFQDDFDRPNATNLGSLWTQQNDVTSDSISPTGFFVGPGYTEINNGSLAFHYNNDSGKQSHPFTRARASKNPYNRGFMKRSISSMRYFDHRILII